MQTVLKEDEVAEILMELSDAGYLEDAEGCDLARDDDGWYVKVVSLSPDKMNLPDEYKGVRLKTDVPPGHRGHVGYPTKMIKRGEMKMEKPPEDVILD